MAQAVKKQGRSLWQRLPLRRGLREVALWVLGAAGLYLLMALVSYHATDPGWSRSTSFGQVQNAGGVVGAWFADVLLFLFGDLAYLLPLMVVYGGWLLYKGRKEEANPDEWAEFGVRTIGLVLTVLSGCSLAALHFASPDSALPANAGGILGDAAGSALVASFNRPGATLLLLAVFLTGVTLATGLSWLWVMDKMGRLTLRLAAALRDGWQARRGATMAAVAAGTGAAREPLPRPERSEPKPRPLRIEPPAKKIEVSERAATEKQQPLFKDGAPAGLPPLSLLDPAEPSGKAMSPMALEQMSRLVEAKLRDFGIEVEVVAVHPGPVITRYELQPGSGVKVSQISGLAKDLARALSAISVRIVEVIPGKSVIGLEIPNEHREVVRLSELIQSKQYDASASPLTLALGKDIGGHPMVADLGRMPHLLVAGTTGSGKSVAINAMILSFLYKAKPEEVRMILIDPKMLELSVYDGIPHLLTPVVTDMKEAANALRWCVAEMDRRYRLMAALGVRNIAGYNRKVADAIAAGEPIRDPLAERELSESDTRPLLEPLPYIVVVVDELADMMMVVGKKVEELIARLAQKARASGIHLLLATQRPSVDVLTGLIKANIPTRISFQVSSKIDSRTILDQMGAEQLLGHGDMLYLAPGTGVPTRIHGAFVADHEVHKVVEALKQGGAPNYIEEILEGPPEAGADFGGSMEGGNETDELYDQAVRIVTESRRASVSGIQRRLKIGYNRAARMVEDMERAGVVGPLQSNGMREVLAPPPPER